MRLAQKSGLELSEEQADQLDEISTFNINARYDNYQEEFYHRCTHDYTELWIKQIKEIEIWLQNQL
ncbi:MAG: HEPN domain-containing protein [Candidatus Marinimicrobia bacterium]|nr:HEPN domain-containing protein [Candidatus Neomarinimicrobiota bacterium]